MEVLEGNQPVVSNNQKLYNNLIDSKRATVDEIGDFDTFNSMLGDSTKAVKLYQNLVKESRFKPEEIGTQEDFLLNIDPIQVPEASQPQTERETSYIPEVTNEGKSLLGSIPATNQGLSALHPEYSAPKISDSYQTEKVTTLPQGTGNEFQAINQEQLQKEVGGAQINSNTPPEESLIFSTPEEEKTDLANNILEKSQRQKDAVTGEGDNFGVTDALRDRNFWTLGSSDLSSMVYLKKIANKLENGESLTDGDKTLLEAWNTSEQINQQFPASDANIWYKTGKNITDMVPWLIQFGATRGIGTGTRKAVETTLRANAEKYLGTTIAKGLSKGLAETAGAYAAASLMPNTYADITRRTLGDTYKDEIGNVQFDGETADSNIKAIYKGWTNGMLEVLTERLGEGLGGALVTKWPKSKLAKFIAGEGGLNATTNLSKFTKSVGWDGAPMEYFEEFVNTPLNALLVGDSKYSDVIDGKQQLETLMTVVVMGQAMKAVNATQNKMVSMQADRDYKSAKSLFNTEIDPEVRTLITDVLESDGSLEEQGTVLHDLLSTLEGEKAGIALNYIVQSERYNQRKSGSQQPSASVSTDGTQFTVDPKFTEQQTRRQQEEYNLTNQANEYAHIGTGNVTVAELTTPSSEENLGVYVISDLTNEPEPKVLVRRIDGQPFEDGEITKGFPAAWVNKRIETNKGDFVRAGLDDYDYNTEPNESLIKRNRIRIEGKQFLLTGELAEDGGFIATPLDVNLSQTGEPSIVIQPQHLEELLNQERAASNNSEVIQQENNESVTSEASQDNESKEEQPIERKISTQTIGKTPIDIIEGEEFDEVVPSDKVSLEKALSVLEKEFKDNEDFNVVAERVQVEIPAENKYKKPTFQTVIKSIKIVPVAKNVNIENQNSENISDKLEAPSDNQLITNEVNQESLQNNQLQNEESEKVDQQPDGITANEGENTPQEEQGEGVQENLEENVDWGDFAKNVKGVSSENIQSIKSLNEYKAYLQDAIKQLSSDKSTIVFAQEKQDIINGIDAYFKNNQNIQAVPPVVGKSFTPGDSAPLIDETTKEISQQGMNLNPTEKQIDAGNYKKAHITIQGMDIAIENPKGSFRKGVDEDGKAWETEMKSHYGYFNGTNGKDGDHIDTFIGDNPESQTIFVVDQNHVKTGEFDESKVMTGFNSIDEAKAAYLANYEPGWQGLRNITAVPVDQFKEWLNDGAKQAKPFAEYKGHEELLKIEKDNARKAKQQAKQLSPEEAKQRAINRANALSLTPVNLEQAVLQYIAAGNRFNWDEIKRELFPTSHSEMMQRIGMLKKDAKTIDNLRGILNGLPFEDEANEVNVFRNAVLNAILNYPTLNDAVNRINQIGSETPNNSSLSDFELGEALQAIEQEDRNNELDALDEIYSELEKNGLLPSEDELIELFLQDNTIENEQEINQGGSLESDRPVDPKGSGENRPNLSGNQQGISAKASGEVKQEKELTPLEKEIQSLQAERAELLSKKVKTAKNVNSRNGLFGDIAANPNDLFGGQGFDAAEAQRIINGIDQRIATIDQKVSELTQKIQDVKATAEKENAGQQELVIPEVKPLLEVLSDGKKEVQEKKPIQVRLFKHGEGGTKGLFEDSKGNLYKSLVRTYKIFDGSKFEAKEDEKESPEYEILKSLQGNPNIPVIGDRVITSEGPAFKIEKLDEVNKLTLADYLEIEKILDGINDQGFFVNDNVTVMRRPKSGELVIVDFSGGLNDKALIGNPSYSDNGFTSRLNDMLSEEDKAEVGRIKDERHEQLLEKYFGKKDKNTEFKYNLRSRPFSIGTYPPDNFIRFEEDGTQFGSVIYSKEVPLSEIKRFELVPSAEGLAGDYDFVFSDKKFPAKVEIAKHQKGFDIIKTTINGKEEKMSVVEFMEQVNEGRFVKVEKQSPVDPEVKEAPVYGSENKLVNKDRFEELKRKMREKGNNLNSGFDPEMFAMGAEMAAYHIEAGARKFAEFSKAMIDDLGDWVKPYLKSFYNGARDFPGMESYEQAMDEYSFVKTADIDQVVKQLNDNIVKLNKEKQDVSNRPDNSKPDSSKPADEVPADAADVPVNRGRSGKSRVKSTRNGSKAVGQSGSKVGSGLFADLFGEQGDNELHNPDQKQPIEGNDAGDTDGRGSRTDGSEGLQNEQGANGSNNSDHPTVSGTFAERTAQKLIQQQAAENIQSITGDIDNIRETLPFLLSEQQDDVFKAETRFFDPKHQTKELANGKGMLFTNGTGTGKTYTGLGIVKRFVKQGKGNVLIVVPSEAKVNDWSADGENLGLNITPLTNTTTGGTGAVVTTYANFRENKELLKREFDLVVYDESHRLMEEKKGATSSTTTSHYAISNKDLSSALSRLQSVHPVWIESKSLFEKYTQANKNFNANMDFMDWQVADRVAEIKKMNDRLEDLDDQKKMLLPGLTEQARQAVERTKVVFLSATPFKGHFNLRYANGILFDWSGEITMQGRSRVNPEARFFLDNFGSAYVWRFHQLQARRNANADAIAMQEIQFAQKLMSQGVMSGRAIESDKDYSREFPLVALEQAEVFNKALNEIYSEEFNGLSNAAGKVFSDYNYTTKLFESLKASMSISRIQDHLDLGRKVIVFHRRKQANVLPPFQQILDVTRINAKAVLAGADENTSEKTIDEANQALGHADLFESKYADLLRYEQTLNYNPAIDQITAAFPGRVVTMNGDTPKKDKSGNVKLFNDDNSGKDIFVVQEEAGKEGISLHDTTGKHQRVLISLSLPISSTTALQIEGRPYRIGNESDAIFEYPLLGLDQEIIDFGSKVNKKLSTTENLAIGDQARDLLRSFAEGVLFNSGTDKPNINQGKGGKEYDKKAQETLSEFRKAVLVYNTNQKTTGRRDQREGVDYFATPEPVGQKMVEWLNLAPEETGLEPSAGHGAIAMWFPKHSNITAIEPSFSLFSKLNARSGGGDKKILNVNFEDFNIINKFNGIAMNPPFGSGGKTAMDHVEKAFHHLKDGGRLVAIIPNGPSMTKRLDAFLYGENEKGKLLNPEAFLIGQIQLPSVAFEQAGTAVSSRVVIIERHITAPESLESGFNYDLSDIKKVDFLFDEIENIEIPKTKRTEPEIDRNTPLMDVLANGKAEVSGVKESSGTKLMPVEEFKHTQTGQILYNVKINGRSDEYDKFSQVAKKHKPYTASKPWNRYSKGFLFNTKDDAIRFKNEVEGESEAMFSIIGEKGAANIEGLVDNLAMAKEMTEAGKDAKTIFLATGWEKFPDGWKYDLPDNLEFKNIGARKLGQVLGQDNELFKVYPRLRYIEMAALGVDPYENAEGSFDPKGFNGKPTIYAIAPTEKELKSVLAHEIQHAIQDFEGFASGGNLKTAYADLEDQRILLIRQRNILMKESRFLKILLIKFLKQD